MNKYIVLLIVPFLLFHVGCEKDEENNIIIPISDYPEFILGHWKYDSLIFKETVTYIDPIYGTEIIDNVIEINTVYPTPYQSDYLIDRYDTYKYDGTYDTDDFLFDPEDLNNPVDYYHFSYSNGYTINEDIIVYSNWFLNQEIIQLTETSLHTKSVVNYTWGEIEGDTIYSSNITRDTYMSKVDELPPTPRSSTQHLTKTIDVLGRNIKLRPSH